ncbi:hypothetical protein [Winogradskyella ouciana]|uniref:ParB/Sulfiredoxin domain-containing protein n=1 Tax=Winogradskyella ouciana TaxID=2608631 RepID=A0A7K1GCJ4_9FLAO|nr:hypothetical protein [Winogradskyella ouciana]MTE27020.1 hypothetical protein [Winogradskyella ouciana]
MKLGYTLPEIQQHFTDLILNKERESKDKFHVPVNGIPELTEVYEVPLDLPRYRLNNTRTIALQEQYIASNDLKEDYFETNLLSDKLQEIQHGFLTKLIKRKGLKEYFQDAKNIQTDPLILTHEGFVISGNRRLCTFRELYYNSENGMSKYKHFERIRVVILPKITEEKIEYIEDYFEQQPDIQDEFTWTNKALGFEKRLKKHGYSVKDLANKTNVKKSSIEALLNKLSLAKEYLDFRGNSKAYDIIENDEYAFNELLKSRKKFLDNPVQKDIFQKLSFIALKNQDQISDRMYKNIPVIQEVIEDIQEEIETEFSNEIETIEYDNPNTDLFSEINIDNDNSFGVLKVIENQENENSIFSIVLDKVDEHKLLKREKKRKQEVLIKIQKANKELNGAYNIVNSETSKDGIEKQLDNIENVVTKLRDWLTND